MFTLLKIRYKITFNRPIYRVDVLNNTKLVYANRAPGLCYSINSSLKYLIGDTNLKDIVYYIPLFGVNVNSFWGNIKCVHWWKEGKWDTGRLDYLNWLIEQYKNDKTDLRKL